MKLPVIVLITSAMLEMSSANAITVSAGDVLDLQFQSLPLLSSYSLGLSPRVTFSFGGLNLFDAGESFEVDYYSDSFMAPPDRSVTYTNSSEPINGIIQNLNPEIYSPVFLNWNNDRQGAMRLTMLSGSFDLGPTLVEVWNVSNYFAGYYSFSPSPVPEPNSGLLLASAFPLLYWWMRKRTRKS